MKNDENGWITCLATSDATPWRGRALNAVFLRIVAERAVGHLQQGRGLRADTSGAFQGGKQVRPLQPLDVLLQAQALLRQVGMVPVAIVPFVRNRPLEMVLD